jgi:hypothetical protein
MAITASKPAINVREKLAELDFDKVPFQKIPAGSVVQVISTTFAAASTSATSATDIFSISITPKSATSKILVTGALQIYRNAAGHNELSLYRGSSVLVSITTKDGYGAFHSMLPLNYLDSPSTIESVTYKVTGYKRSGEGGTLYFGDGRTNNTITLTEIAQ